MKILYLDATVRPQSRTAELAQLLLTQLDGEVTHVKLSEIAFPVTDASFLARRDRGIAAQDFSDPLFALAKQFAAAECIVIAAPYWDLSFPASLKQYFEQINVIGLTFCYTEDGIPQGLCKAQQLYYVTTAGGTAAPDTYGFGYVQALAQRFYGIPDCKLFKAEGLDLYGADPDALLDAARQQILVAFGGNI
ncbi:MAG: NAD(P)H-dependent oxidoreductase [Oscillospiraceae bacterium]|nr:NAD(P)H-dependent oxidoreductase [Oscillospiraceae bacterium]